MKCKRCGEPLDPLDTYCPVCGRAAEPRKKAPPKKKTDSTPPIKLPQLDRFTRTYARDNARTNLLQLGTIAAVAVVIVLAVMVNSGVGALQKSMDQLQQSVDAQVQLHLSQNQPAPTDAPEIQTNPIPDEPAPTEGEEPVLSLSRQDLTAALRLYRTDSGTYASAAMNPSYATAWVSTAQESIARRVHATWILEGTGDRLALKLHESYGGEEIQADLTLSWVLSGNTFSGFSEAVCAWEYRAPGGEWGSVPNDAVTTDAGATRLALSSDRLAALLGGNSSIELRCQIVQNHFDGGTLRIITDGITMDAFGPVRTGSLLD